MSLMEVRVVDAETSHVWIFRVPGSDTWGNLRDMITAAAKMEFSAVHGSTQRAFDPDDSTRMGTLSDAENALQLTISRKRSSLSIVVDTLLSNEGPWKLVIPIEKNWGFVRQEISAMTRFDSLHMSDERSNSLEFDDEILLSDLTKDHAMIIILLETTKHGLVRESSFEPGEVRDARNALQSLKRCNKNAKYDARVAGAALTHQLQVKQAAEANLEKMKFRLDLAESGFLKAYNEYEDSLEASKGTGDPQKMRRMHFWNCTRLEANVCVLDNEKQLGKCGSAIAKAEADARSAQEIYVAVTQELATAVATCRRLCNNILI